MSTDTWYQKRQGWIEACCQRLLAQRVIEPLSTDERETRDWISCELASLAEGHLHVQLDAARLSEEERLGYEQRVSYHGRPLASPHDGYSHPFWLLADGQRVGTIAIAKMVYGLDLISISRNLRGSEPPARF